jgi:hypothetical protein
MGKFRLVWYRDIEGYDRYFAEGISGSIYSKQFRHSNKPHAIKPFYRRKTDKYLGVNLWKDGKQGNVIALHKIIADTFPEICGEWFEGAVINHKDENPENNSCLNLEYCTVAYNNSYGTAWERQKQTRIANGAEWSGYKINTPEWREYWNSRRREKWAALTEEEKHCIRLQNNQRQREKRAMETKEEKSIRRAKARQRYWLKKLKDFEDNQK